MTRPASLLVGASLTLLLASDAVPSAQSQPTAPQGLILGRVIDAGTGAGVSGAAVTVTIPPPAGQPSGPQPQRPVILTDGDGRFVLFPLPAGRINLSVSSRGYLQQQFGALRPGGNAQPLELAPGEKLTNVVVRIWKGATITGRILDDDGEPVDGVNIGILRKEVIGGRPRWTTGGAGQSDDRGAYKSTGLLPGKYVVVIATPLTTVPRSAMDLIADYRSASQAEQTAIDRRVRASDPPFLGEIGYRVGDLYLAPPPGGTTLNSVPDASGRFMVVGSTFYPAGSSPDEAVVLTIAPGEVRTGIDFHLRMVRTTSISGVVTRTDGGSTAHLGVRLGLESLGHLGTFFALETGATLTDLEGRFTLLGVPRGSYLIRARVIPFPATPRAETEPVIAAVVPVSVGDTPVRDIAVSLVEAPRVSGRVEFESATPPPAAQIARLVIEVQTVDIRYASTSFAPRSLVAATGEFKTGGVTAGSYVIRATGLPGWTVKSAMRGGQDLSDQPFEPTSDVTGVVVTLTDRVTTVSGVVTRPAGGPDSDAAVLAFPSDPTRVGVRRRQFARVDAKGAYVINGLPAGDYVLVAIDDRLAADWEEPAFLNSLVRLGTRVTVPSSGAITIDLRTSAIRREVP